MDEIRDIRKSDPMSRFLDDHAVRTNPFGKNIAGERAYRRAERLVVALYLLTSHIPLEEPARISVRDQGINLMAGILAVRDEMRAPRSQKIRAVESSIRELISLVRVLTVAGYISFQNADTAIEALDELGNLLVISQRSQLSEATVISKEELMGAGSGVSGKHIPGGKEGNVRDMKDTRLVSDALRVKDTESPEKHDKYLEETITARAQSILNVLRLRGNIGIKDIASNLPEYSEKMIQRELALLAARGRVKKTGFKRWSKYSLVA